MSSVSLEDAVASALSDEIAKEIDFEILSGMLIQMGWTKVVLTPMTRETSVEIDQWLVDNCKGRHNTLGLVWVFENSQDANWFKMRWL